MKNLKVALLAGLLLLVIFAPAFGREVQKPEIVFWYSLSGSSAPVMEKMTEKFSAENPCFTLKAKNFSTPAELFSALLTDQNTPDIALVDTAWLDMLIKSERIIPAEDVLKRMGDFVLLSYKSETYPSQYALHVRNETLMAVPGFVQQYGLLYNKAIFTQAKIGKFPPTWEDFIKVAKKLTNPAADQWGFYLPLDPDSLGILFQISLWQAGGDVYDPQVGAFVLDSQIAQGIVQRWSDLVNKYKIAPNTELSDLSKVAMFVGTAEDLLNYEKQGLKLSVAPIPIGKNPATLLRSFSYVVFKAPDKKLDSTGQFLRWMTEVPQVAYWAVNTTYVPVNKRMAGNPEYVPVRQAHPGLDSFVKMMDSGKIPSIVKDYDKVITIIGTHLSDAIKTNGDIQAALQAAETECNGLLK